MYSITTYKAGKTLKHLYNTLADAMSAAGLIYAATGVVVGVERE